MTRVTHNEQKYKIKMKIIIEKCPKLKETKIIFFATRNSKVKRKVLNEISVQLDWLAGLFAIVNSSPCIITSHLLWKLKSNSAPFPRQTLSQRNTKHNYTFARQYNFIPQQWNVEKLRRVFVEVLWLILHFSPHFSFGAQMRSSSWIINIIMYF